MEIKKHRGLIRFTRPDGFNGRVRYPNFSVVELTYDCWRDGRSYTISQEEWRHAVVDYRISAQKIKRINLNDNTL